MAQLDVQPKRSKAWWPWLLLALVALALLFYFLRGHSTDTAVAGTDSTNIKSDTSKNANNAAVSTTPPDADMSDIDINAPSASYGEITDKGIGVQSNNKYTIYSLGEDILFATDQSTLQPKADAQLKQIAASINKRYKGSSLAVYGNTDSTGSTSHNNQLGAQRAQAVSAWLAGNAGIAQNKITVRSLGASKPVAPNTTAGGRKENRNVRIVVYPDSTSH